ncbi:cysteine protease ATG4 isoform X1 [Amborella trichopoda]|uniref:Cysteine protease n=2 Tax=Amborella trichopoda TaxID=13333 RepID=U5D485_AMBTC|nr:cysteine protease ATG4 isoform X1 [Amborella trichopoda]ERN17015.1 hypothetical protein AMTR_s00057p00218370 [Amborella trichopoda]|eukprot:XP_006855548.1 cysteine protease ATG4 isoform X1 [Amborella trichopoda]
MKGLPEKSVDSKFCVGSSAGSTEKEPFSPFDTERENCQSKSLRTSLWSSLVTSPFSMFESYNESNSSVKTKVLRNRTYRWSAALRRALAGSPMRLLQERILGLCKTGVSNSNGDIWLLGVCYKVSSGESSSDLTHANGKAAFLQDLSSRIWITYRKGFETIGDLKLTSDAGWGCMIRSSQMLVAQALLSHHLGRSWSKPTHKPFDPEYVAILHLFGDSEASSLSIHNLLKYGKGYGLAAGSWLGPYAMCRTWETLARISREQIHLGDRNVSLPMALYVVSGDEDGERGGAPVLCIEDAERICASFCGGQESWAPLLLLVPLVLGLDKVNPRYIPSLWATFTFPQSTGILGGKPGASTYIVGVQDDQALYLDPHEVQSVVNIDPGNLEAETSSYHCNVVRQMPFDTIDPSLAIGFYCRDKDDFEDFCTRAAEIASNSNGAPLFTVTNSKPVKKGALASGSSVCEDEVSNQKLVLEADSFEGEANSLSNEDDWQLL